MDLIKLPQGLRRYRAAALVVLVGIFLMALPGRGEKPPEPPTQAESRDLSQSLSEVLSRMEGAGEVQVLLTEAEGEKRIYEQDQDRNGEDFRSTTVLISGTGREEAGLLRQIDPPRYLGAVILSQGAGSSAVRLALSEAVSKATGLSFDRITVLKMK